MKWIKTSEILPPLNTWLLFTTKDSYTGWEKGYLDYMPDGYDDQEELRFQLDSEERCVTFLLEEVSHWMILELPRD